MQKKNNYIKSMIADLKQDTASLKAVVDFNIKKLSGIDRLSLLLNKPSLTLGDEKQLYILNYRYASNVGTMVWNDGTIRQLLTSGNLRLMSQQGTSDSIMNYYGAHKDDASGQGDVLYESAKRTYFGSEDIFDRSFITNVINKNNSFSEKPMPDTMKLITKEKTLLKKYSQMVLTTGDLVRSFYFEETDRTIQQLNNSGNFRLIKNDALADSIIDYEKNIASYKDNHPIDIEERQFLYPFIATIFDANVFQIMVDSTNHIQRISGLHFLHNENNKLNNQFIYYLHQVKSTITAEKILLLKNLHQTSVIKNIIHENYNSQN